jgi:hypothetical protein
MVNPIVKNHAIWIIHPHAVGCKVKIWTMFIPGKIRQTPFGCSFSSTTEDRSNKDQGNDRVDKWFKCCLHDENIVLIKINSLIVRCFLPIKSHDTH